MQQSLNISITDRKRVVIIGAGFGGLQLARQLRNTQLEVVLLDRNNYHQFQPLFYQVAMSGLEPSSILFPLRKIFQNTPHVHVRICEVVGIDTTTKGVSTTIGDISYDYLVIATGADTNYFGNEALKERVIPMKSIAEALLLRNAILEDYEKAVTTADPTELDRMLDICVVGGGATGVELAGALAEMKTHILPKDYPEIDPTKVQITMIQGASRVLDTMSESASAATLKYLQDMGVDVILNKFVKDFDGRTLTMHDGSQIETGKVIWAAGITGQPPAGLPAAAIGAGNRIKVDPFMQVEGCTDVFAIGDAAVQTNEVKWPKGHPQVAQTAIQMGKTLAKNLKLADPKQWKPFQYKDLGSMATIGRNKAVVDMPQFKFKGFIAWLAWMFIHLLALVGGRNKMVVFFNWMWSYITYDQSLRLLIKPINRNIETPSTVERSSFGG